MKIEAGKRYKFEVDILGTLVNSTHDETFIKIFVENNNEYYTSIISLPEFRNLSTWGLREKFHVTGTVKSIDIDLDLSDCFENPKPRVANHKFNIILFSKNIEIIKVS